MTAQQPSRDDVPEADLLEQQAPADPPILPDAEAAADSPDTPPVVPKAEADEADLLEQLEVVAGDDDEYPHEP